MSTPQQVWIDYTNHRGERAYRRIHPLKVSFEYTEWHRVSQWLLEAVDLDKSAVRKFAMSSIHDWFSIEEAQAAEALLREKVSPSFLQRRMEIGYERAVRLIALFERRGLIKTSPDTGAQTFVTGAA